MYIQFPDEMLLKPEIKAAYDMILNAVAAKKQADLDRRQLEKRSRGVHPHVDTAMNKFEPAEGVNTPMDDFVLEMIRPFDAGKHPEVCVNEPAITGSLLQLGFKVVDGQIQNLQKRAA